MRSLPIVHARPFAQPRLALRAISDNYGRGSKYTDKKTGRKITLHFLGDAPPAFGHNCRVTAPD
jgi:hypothetical protein